MDRPGRARTELGPAWAQLVDRLEVRSRIGMMLGLERLGPVLAQLGHPERAFPSIHIAGSNGKGSTAAFLASLLSQRGARVGLYTSPHLVSLTERVQVVERGMPREIEAAPLLAAFEQVERIAPELTFFEVITAAGLVALAELGVDVAVIEAGIGAKNDATRAVDASVSVLAELSIEHTQILGHTLAAIAEDKAAVVRPGRPLVMADAPEEAMVVVERAARRAGAPLYRIGRELFVERRADGQVTLVIGDRRIDGVTLSLLGPHQARNALLATAAAALLDPALEDEDVRRALAHTRWPGRMEVFRVPGAPPLLLDGAHNPQGVQALVAAIAADPTRFEGPLHVVFAVLGDKDAAPMIHALAGIAASLTLTRPGDTPRARAPEDIRALLPAGHTIPSEVVPTVEEALDRARARARADGGWVVVAGSLYLVGEVRAELHLGSLVARVVPCHTHGVLRPVLALATAIAMFVVVPVHAAAEPPLAVSVHRASVRFDPARGVPIGGGPEDAAPLPASPLRLRMVRDEVVSFQLALRGAPRTTTVRTTTLAGARIDVFAERGVPVTKPSVSTVARPLGPGLYPDPLVPTSTVHVPPAPGVSVLWIDVWAAPDARPGTRTGRIEIEGAAPIELSVEILDLQLPRTDVARIGAVSFGSLLERRARNPRRFVEWMQLAHAHRLTIELMLTRVSTAAEGTLDWSRWADEYAPLIDGRAFTESMGYRGPRAGLPIGRFVVPMSEKWPSPSTPRLLPSDPQRWSRELKRWEQEVERRGWFALPEATQWIVFINSLDEPKHAMVLEALRQFGVLIDAAGLVDRRRVSTRVDGPFAQNAEGWSDERIVEELRPAIDLWCLCGGTPWIPWRLLDELRVREPSERLMFYASNTAGEPATPPLVLDAELTHARAWGWIIRAYGLAGALNWEVDFRPGCATDPLCSTFGLNTDATLIYRGEELGRGFDEPIASMRLKMLRRGAEDAALVSLLEARDPDAARELLDRIVPEAMGDGHSRDGPGAWPIEGVAYDRARDEILDRLMGIEPAEAPLARGSMRAWIVGFTGAAVLVFSIRRVRRSSRREARKL